jgi:glycine/D-amino acid oxidase-like deaminating enzyme
MRRAMVQTVDEVGRVAASADIDIDYAKGGTIAFARSTVQLEAAREEVEEAQRYGVDETELWGIHRVKAAGALGASYDPACARIHPAKLVRGLAVVPREVVNSV